MPTLVPIDHDPFTDEANKTSSSGVTLVPVDHDPFAPPPPSPPAERGYIGTALAGLKRGVVETGGKWII